MEDEIKELKSVLRSLVVSSPTQVDVRTLMRDYRSMVGKPIPLAKYGYKDPVQFLKERFTDCFVFQGQALNPVLTLIVPDSLKHIDKFVQKQKVTSTHKNKEKRRSIPVANLSPKQNLICESFTQKQKIKSQNSVKKVLEVDKDKITNQDTNPQENNVNLDSNHKEKDSSKDDTDSGRQTSSSNDSAKWTQLEELKVEIKSLILDHPEGVWCTELIRLYRERYGRELNFSRFGYTSVLSLACVLEDSLSIWRPEGAADWKLLARRPPSATSPHPPPSPQRPHPPLPPHPPPPSDAVDPDDALPGIDFEADVFPADCMHYMESIPHAEMPEESMIEVQVGELYSPSHLWLIRLGDAYNIAMEELMDEMNEYYWRGEGRGRVLARGAVRPGHYCSSCYEGDWHRSLIVKVLDSDTVKVRHVDYGTVERCAAAQLRPLLRRWARLPQQALRARLAGVRPPAGGRRWPRASAAHLLRRLSERRLVAQLVARAPRELEVVLVDTSADEDVCINAELVRSGHADARADCCLGVSGSGAGSGAGELDVRSLATAVALFGREADAASEASASASQVAGPRRLATWACDEEEEEGAGAAASDVSGAGSHASGRLARIGALHERLRPGWRPRSLESQLLHRKLELANKLQE
ncbi:unnamed protein product, partial [Iphiclides podalirius]